MSVVRIPDTTSPSSTISPLVGVTMPRIVFSVVVLPLALPPSRQTISPARISMSTSFSMCTGP